MNTTPSEAVRPLLLLDVDGPINPWKRLHQRVDRRTGESRYSHDAPPPWVYYDNVTHRHPRTEAWGKIPFLVHPDHGQALLDLTKPENGGYRLIWATTWEEEANRILAPLLGLPPLPVIPLPDSANWTWKRRTNHRGSGKTQMLATWLDDYAPGVPWAWVDDEANRYDRTWFANWYRHHERPVPFLVRFVEAHHGLRPTDFAALRAWALDLSDPEGTLNP